MISRLLAISPELGIIKYMILKPWISGEARESDSMKLALIADVHANLEALEAVLQAIARENVDHIIHLGDLVGYNANPRECIDLICQHNVLCVAGNHDRAILDPTLAQDFNILAYQAVIWSCQQLTDKHKDFLRQLPVTRIIQDRFLACHGNPVSPDAYISHHFQGKRVRICSGRSWLRPQSVFSAIPTAGLSGTGMCAAGRPAFHLRAKSPIKSGQPLSY